MTKNTTDKLKSIEELFNLHKEYYDNLIPKLNKTDLIMLDELLNIECELERFCLEIGGIDKVKEEDEDNGIYM